MSSDPTPEALEAGPFENAGHADFGGLHVTIMRHTTIRRLISLNRPLVRRNQEPDENTVERQWLVDGQPVNNLVEAVSRLTVPPRLTDDEIFVLEKLSEHWLEMNEFQKLFPEIERPKVSPTLVRLHLKGLVENKLKTNLQRSIPLIRRTPIAPSV